jgi:hypothetical protein
VKLISNVKIFYLVLILFFISLFIHQQVYAQLDYVNEEISLQLKYSEHWKFNKDTPTDTDAESAKLLNKKVGKVLDDTTIFSITLYPNMSSLEDDKVYKNLSSLADTRVYTNLSSFGDKVFSNISSLESSKVFSNISSLESSKVFSNMSSLADTRVYTNISSLSQ